MKKPTIYLIILIIFISFSCSNDSSTKEETSTFDEAATIELLKSHPWKIDYQLLNGVKCNLLTDQDDPYIINFLNDGFIEFANFSDWSKNEELWEISNEKLIMDGDPFSIETLTSTKLVIKCTEDGNSHSYAFTEEGDTNAFPQYIVGKIYRPVSGNITEEGVTDVVTIEDGYDFTQKFWIQDNNIMTMTDTMMYYLSWNKISESFIFLEEHEKDLLEGENAGYEISLGSNGDITVKYCYMIEGRVKSSESSLIETTMVLRECNLWDYLNGPNWVLIGVDKNDVALTEFPDMPFGTIWFFNSYTKMIEERTSYSDTEIEFLPWKFTEEPSEDNIRIDITLDQTITPNEIRTFKAMKINIAELWLSTGIDGDHYNLRFAIEEYK
ncbi:MAG: hypothetical protein WCS56_05445 [Bacilli bacterium]